jgi:hypothetical protein
LLVLRPDFVLFTVSHSNFFSGLAPLQYRCVLSPGVCLHRFASFLSPPHPHTNIHPHTNTVSPFCRRWSVFILCPLAASRWGVLPPPPGPCRWLLLAARYDRICTSLDFILLNDEIHDTVARFGCTLGWNHKLGHSSSSGWPHESPRRETKAVVAYDQWNLPGIRESE